MLADGLDRIADLDTALINRWPTGRFDRVGDIGRRHRTEQPAALARSLVQPDGHAAELLGDLLGIVEVADIARIAGAADLVNLLLATARPPDRQPARQQVVTAITVAHLNDVARGTEASDLVGHDQLHE